MGEIVKQMKPNNDWQSRALAGCRIHTAFGADQRAPIGVSTFLVQLQPARSIRIILQ